MTATTTGTAAPKDARLNATDLLLGPALDAGRGAEPALIHRDAVLSYDELDALTNRFGNALAAAGVEPGNRVLFLMNDTPELVAGYLGAMRIGAVAVAFNVRAAAKDLLFAIRDTRCKVLFIDAEFAHLYREIAGELARPPLVVVAGAGSEGHPTPAQFIAGQPDTLDTYPTGPDDMALWVYTSGTTGTPKAAVHLHHDVRLGVRHMRENFDIRPGDRVFSSSKMFFAYALGHVLIGGLSTGATLILYDGWPDAEAVRRVVAEHEPDALFSVPTFYRNLLRDGAARDPAFRRVRRFVSAGEKLPTDLFHGWVEATGAPILEGIGTSETIFLFFCNRPDAYRPGSCGRQVPWAEVRLVDDAGAEIAEPDTAGTLWVRMDAVADRYWNRQDTTQRAFQGGWYNTGDMFRFDADGWWYHEGRADDMLKISGQWVSPAEIEEAALALPDVAEACAVGAENADGLVRTALFVVPAAAGAEPVALAEAVRARLLDTLSVYKCPRVVQVVDEIPRTATGKAQRFRLKELARAAIAEEPDRRAG